MSPPLPLAAVSLTLGYNEPEDRLVLIAADAAGARLPVLMTRRLTGRLINGLASLVERSSAMASKVPAELRDDIILLEHQDAVFGQQHAAAQRQPGPGSTAGLDLSAVRLVKSVDVTVTPQAFRLLFRDAREALITLSLTRLAVHQVLETIGRQSEAAGWDITIDAAWLDPGQTEIVFN